MFKQLISLFYIICQKGYGETFGNMAVNDTGEGLLMLQS